MTDELAAQGDQQQHEEDAMTETTALDEEYEQIRGYHRAAGIEPHPTGGTMVIKVAGLPLPLWDEWRALMAVPAEWDEARQNAAVVELVRERGSMYGATQ